MDDATFRSGRHPDGTPVVQGHRCDDRMLSQTRIRRTEDGFEIRWDGGGLIVPYDTAMKWVRVMLAANNTNENRCPECGWKLEDHSAEGMNKIAYSHADRPAMNETLPGYRTTLMACVVDQRATS